MQSCHQGKESQKKKFDLFLGVLGVSRVLGVFRGSGVTKCVRFSSSGLGVSRVLSVSK